jgi:PIN domain nuclease of toxin-antitoxin system
VTVLDASAVLAFLQDEAGAEAVEAALEAGATTGAANWSEVAQKVTAAGGDWDVARAVLAGYELVVEPVTAADAEEAARRWRKGSGLSLGDRLCLALAHRLDVDALTADRSWGRRPPVRQIR